MKNMIYILETGKRIVLRLFMTQNIREYFQKRAPLSQRWIRKIVFEIGFVWTRNEITHFFHFDHGLKPYIHPSFNLPDHLYPLYGCEAHSNASKKYTHSCDPDTALKSQNYSSHLGSRKLLHNYLPWRIQFVTIVCTFQSFSKNMTFTF